MLDAPNPVRIGEETKHLSTFDLALERRREGVRKNSPRAVDQTIKMGLDLEKLEEAKAAAAPALPQEAEPLDDEDEAIALDYLLRQKAIKEAF
jgi:hypothetical protein